MPFRVWKKTRTYIASKPTVTIYIDGRFYLSAALVREHMLEPGAGLVFQHDADEKLIALSLAPKGEEASAQLRDTLGGGQIHSRSFARLAAEYGYPLGEPLPITEKDGLFVIGKSLDE